MANLCGSHSSRQVSFIFIFKCNVSLHLSGFLVLLQVAGSVVCPFPCCFFLSVILCMSMLWGGSGECLGNSRQLFFSSSRFKGGSNGICLQSFNSNISPFFRVHVVGEHPAELEHKGPWILIHPSISNDAFYKEGEERLLALKASIQVFLLSFHFNDVVS